MVHGNYVILEAYQQIMNALTSRKRWVLRRISLGSIQPQHIGPLRCGEKLLVRKSTFGPWGAFYIEYATSNLHLMESPSCRYLMAIIVFQSTQVQYRPHGADQRYAGCLSKCQTRYHAGKSFD